MDLSFIETKTFTKKLFKLWSEESYFKLQEYLLENPTVGDVIPNDNGLRKVRWKAEGRGKSGGVRVIYFYVVRRDVILFLDIYPKNVKSDLTKQELKDLIQIRREEIGE